MKIQELARLRDSLRIVIESTEDEESLDLSPLLPGMKSLYDEIDDHIRDLLQPLLLASETERSRNAMLRGEHRIKLFQDWDQGSHFTEQFKEQIKSQVSWEYPCLEIFPGSGGFLPYMLGAEPLYIADWDKDLLDHVSQQFNSYYSNRRLMKYQFEDSDLSKLPQNSFGFIYSLNWSKLDTEQGLLELARGVYDCLMPGGKYLFAFNSIDTEYGVDMVAMGHRGGADSKSLIAGLEAIGYEIEQSSLASSGWKSSWMIVKRPGEIEYIKAGSILAKIIDKPSDL